MKKIYVLLATLATVSLFSCQKEAEKTMDPSADANLTTITAVASVTDTKAYVDGLQVKWSENDILAVENEEGTSVDFTLTAGENTENGTFSGDLAGKALGTYAVYPKTSNSLFGSDEVFVDYLESWNYGKSEVPMYGVNDGTGEYTFHNIGGAIQVTYTNIPATTLGKFFKITETHTGGEEKYITGIADISDLDSTPNVDLTSLDGQEITVNNIPKDATEATLVIPIPAGTGYNFQVALYEVGETDPIPGSLKNATNRTIQTNLITRFPEIKLKADKDEVLWNENFTGIEDGTQPAKATIAGFNGVKPSYAYSGTYTKIYATGSLDSAPELLIAKSSRSENWVVSNIPTGYWESLTLTYKANQNLSITSSDVTVGDASYEAITEKYGTYTRTITDAGSLVSFSLTFAMQTDNNARIDDIVLTAGAPEPTISVETSAAMATSSLDGTTATLNGSLTLLNGAVNASVTEAGFYYKLTSASVYNKVTCASAPTSTTTFSYNLTSLTKDSEYTYYAYAIYDGGSEVTGEATEKTFTPTQGGGSSTSTLIFSTKCGGSGTADDGTSWTVTSDGTESTFDSDRGIHYGTNNAAVQYIKLTTSSISGTITRIVVNASAASTATVSVKVGNAAFGGEAQTLTSSANDYTFDGSASGEIEVTVTKPSSAKKALYVKSVIVTYTPAS